MRSGKQRLDVTQNCDSLLTFTIPTASTEAEAHSATNSNQLPVHGLKKNNKQKQKTKRWPDSAPALPGPKIIRFPIKALIKTGSIRLRSGRGPKSLDPIKRAIETGPIQLRPCRGPKSIDFQFKAVIETSSFRPRPGRRPRSLISN